jgi:hypothetical protein
VFELLSIACIKDHHYRYLLSACIHIAGVCCPLDLSVQTCPVLMLACVCVGRVGSLHRVRDGKIIQIGKLNPQLPQAFYPVSVVDIQNGDYIVGQCVFDNNENRTLQIG